MQQQEPAKPEEPDEERLGLYHCLRHLASEAALLDLPDVMLVIVKAAGMVRVALEEDPDPQRD